MEFIPEKRRVVITDENLGPIVSIVSILLLISVVLIVLSRLCTRYFLRRQLSLEDGLVFAAAILSTGELVTILGLDSNGLGSPIQTLSKEQVLRFQKYSYSTDVLYVLNIGLTEISILRLIYSLTPVKNQKIVALMAIGFTTLWTISSLFALLFQCHLPHVWQFIDNRCINKVSFWISYTVVHIVTELAVIFLSVVLVWDSKLLRGVKLLVVFPFTLRILVLVPAIAQIAYFAPAIKSRNPTFELWTSVLCAQITQTISITTACFIQLRPFITSLHSGLLHNNDARRRIRQDSRSGSGYLSLGGKGRNWSDTGRSGSDAPALAPESRNVFVGGRDPWGQYGKDLNENSDGSPTSAPAGRISQVIRQTTSIAVEFSDRHKR
ncbi:uncharacterized protein LY89DRAFT_158151 [Mollisia scopiformis]|uniref:Rhodopsin domain-containing protein n=1 Tax=Mollisia scopiformis TaxID=149040 RepID=A0A194X0L5_MOLSC|nr:uncharacterized protein LY89DRAFT_158151 [Mollisia scopiformis]KUJ13412.1 hypothetical protein LY89DRAFT_158151 [Mollisia scopiformis]